MSGDLAAVKRDAEALRRAYCDAGGKPARDSDHNPCPLCGDETGFSMYTHEGLARWKCHAKCGGLSGTIVDLVMKARGVESKEAVKIVLAKYALTSGTAKPLSADGGTRPKGKLHLTLDLAVEAQVYRCRMDQRNSDVREHMPASGKRWHYTDERGEPVFAAIRLDMTRKGAAAKEFVPIRRDGQGWRAGLGPWGKEKKCPLYGLPKILAAVGER